VGVAETTINAHFALWGWFKSHGGGSNTPFAKMVA